MSIKKIRKEIADVKMAATRSRRGNVEMPSLFGREEHPSVKRKRLAAEKAAKAAAAAAARAASTPAPTPSVAAATPPPRVNTRKRKRVQSVSGSESGSSTKPTKLERRWNAENTRRTKKDKHKCARVGEDGKKCNRDVVNGLYCYMHTLARIKKPSMGKSARMGVGTFATKDAEAGPMRRILPTVPSKVEGISPNTAIPRDDLKSSAYRPSSAFLHNITRRENKRNSNMKIIYKGDNEAQVMKTKPVRAGRELFLYQPKNG